MERVEELLQDAAAGDARLKQLLAGPCAATAPALQALYVTRHEAAAICRAAAHAPQHERLWPEHPLVGAVVAFSGGGGRRFAAHVVGAPERAAGADEQLPASDEVLNFVIQADLGLVALSDLAEGAGPLIDIAWQAAWRDAVARAAGGSSSGGGGSIGGSTGQDGPVKGPAVLGSVREVLAVMYRLHLVMSAGLPAAAEQLLSLSKQPPSPQTLARVAASLLKPPQPQPRRPSEPADGKQLGTPSDRATADGDCSRGLSASWGLRSGGSQQACGRSGGRGRSLSRDRDWRSSRGRSRSRDRSWDRCWDRGRSRSRSRSRSRDRRARSLSPFRPRLLPRRDMPAPERLFSSGGGGGWRRPASPASVGRGSGTGGGSSGGGGATTANHYVPSPAAAAELLDKFKNLRQGSVVDLAGVRDGGESCVQETRELAGMALLWTYLAGRPPSLEAREGGEGGAGGAAERAAELPSLDVARLRRPPSCFRVRGVTGLDAPAAIKWIKHNGSGILGLDGWDQVRAFPEFHISVLRHGYLRRQAAALHSGLQAQLQARRRAAAAGPAGDASCGGSGSGGAATAGGGGGGADAAGAAGSRESAGAAADTAASAGAAVAEAEASDAGRADVALQAAAPSPLCLELYSRLFPSLGEFVEAALPGSWRAVRGHPGGDTDGWALVAVKGADPAGEEGGGAGD